VPSRLDFDSAETVHGLGIGAARGATLIGRLFDEGAVARAGLALERALNVGGERPPGF
jgi:hypothetical protein